MFKESYCTEMFYETDMEALVGKYYQVLTMIN